MATIKTDLICNLNQPVNVTYLHGNLFSQDNAGNTINVFVMDNGEPATIGGTVSANVIRSDGQTVAVSGAIEGNKAYVILPQACYAVPGVVHIIIKLTQNTTITTIAAIVANVYMSTTDSVIDPGTVIPSIQALMALIEEAVDSIPTDYTGLLHTIAADYSSSKTYKVGDYAWESGVLKRCIVPITAAETYTAAHWTNAVIGDDLTNLKSALSVIEGAAKYSYSVEGFINTSGNVGTNSQYRATDYIECDKDSTILLTDIYTGASSLAYAFYKSDKTFISGQNSVVADIVDNITIPNNAAYVRFSGRVDDGYGNTRNPSAYVYSFKALQKAAEDNKQRISAVDTKVDAAKADFSNMEKAAMYDYSITGLINTSGVIQPSYTQYRATDFIACDQNSAIAIYDFYTGASSLAYAFYDASKGFISGQNSLASDKAFVQTIPSNAAYVRFSSRLTNGSGTSITPKAVVYNFKGLKEEVNRISSLIPTYNYPYITGQFINTSGNLATNSDYAVTDFILCDNAAYVELNDIYVGSSALGYAFYDKDKQFISGQNSISGYVIVQTIPSSARYIRSSCRVKEGSSTIHSPVITVYNNRTINKNIQELLDDVATLKNSGSNLKDLQILIFGDSITDTQNITIDASTNRTTAYSEKIPNNSYVKNGQTISYYMWPNLIQRVLDVKELRNYALAGAHFYTPSQTPSNPRIKLLYQVQVALNDLSNPNGVFPNNDFNPDIVIVACGINDGNIANGSFESAMNKTIMNQAGTGVDVEATMNNLNQSNVMESMRYVCMLLKQTFPTALFLYVNPLQQTYSTNEARLIAREELRKMAEQYGFVNLDGFGQFGVGRDFETQEQIGMLTKDGLHPNEKGQNLYARNIVQAIKRYYFPLNQFNT